MNASPAMETGGPLVCFGATGDAAVAAPAPREVAVEDLWTGPGEHRRLATTSCSSPSTCRLPRPAPGSAYIRLEYRRQMEIAVVGATAVVTLDGRHRHRCPDRDDGPRAHDPARAGGRGGARGSDGGAAAIEAAGAAVAAAATADLRRPRLGRLPARDGRGDRPAHDRDGARARAREAS